ncbi:MAG TPA: hypothetical protein VMU47_20475 [Caldimonas sp.]|nr:hypothetical protein [Caldimonas sp.]
MSAGAAAASVAAWVWAIFAVTIALEVVGQTAFKLGLDRIARESQRSAFWRALALSPLIAAGIGAHAVEACTWMVVLGRAPMSVVAPMASALAYLGVVLSGALLLRERIGRVRLAGALLVAIGSALLASTTR